MSWTEKGGKSIGEGHPTQLKRDKVTNRQPQEPAQEPALHEDPHSINQKAGMYYIITCTYFSYALTSDKRVPPS